MTDKDSYRIIKKWDGYYADIKWEWDGSSGFVEQYGPYLFVWSARWSATRRIAKAKRRRAKATLVKDWKEVP